jgi:hypothetical protein
MGKIRIPVPTIRWLTVSWGAATETAQPQAQPQAQPELQPEQARKYGPRGPYSLWFQETGRHRKAWERYYQIKREQMDHMVMRTGHKAPFSQQEIMEHSHIFARFLDQRTDPITQGLGRPRLRVAQGG